MKDKITFRGKSIATGKWLIGRYINVRRYNQRYIFPDTENPYEILVDKKNEVNLNTVSIGFYIDDKPYFCGDIIRLENGANWCIVWKTYGFTLESIKLSHGMHDYMTIAKLIENKNHEIIGNIFDNREFLEKNNEKKTG